MCHILFAHGGVRLRLCNLIKILSFVTFTHFAAARCNSNIPRGTTLQWPDEHGKPRNVEIWGELGLDGWAHQHTKKHDLWIIMHVNRSILYVGGVFPPCPHSIERRRLSATY